MKNFSTEIKNLLCGSIDMHVHTAPSYFERLLDDFALAEELAEYNMGGALIKCHEGSSVFRSILTNKYIGNKSTLYGSLVLNVYVGGFNPYAVDSEIKLGASVIFMPTISAKNHIDFYGGSHYNSQKNNKLPMASAQGLTIFNDYGFIKDEVIEILDIIAKEDITLATGHLSTEEGLALCETALKRGLKKIIYTHADFEATKLNLQQQIELSKKGVFIEKTYLCLTPQWLSISAEETAKGIMEIGADSIIMSTDFGQKNNPSPVEGLGEFIKIMLQQGIRYDDIKKMVSNNPIMLLK